MNNNTFEMSSLHKPTLVHFFIHVITLDIISIATGFLRLLVRAVDVRGV